MRMLLGAALLVAVAGCSKGGSASKPPEAPLVGGLGKRIVSGPVTDLRLSKDGAWATILHNPKRPAVEGVSPRMALGELGLVPLGGGAVRFVGQGVSNRPGSVLYSPDSKWLFFVEGYNAANDSGTLRTLSLTPGAEPELRGKAVSFVTVSPVGDAFAFVDAGVLRVARLEAGSTARNVATDVSTAQFTPDGKWLVVQRRAAAGGGVLLSPVEGVRAPVRLGENVRDWSIAPDGRRVALALTHPKNPDLSELSVAMVPEGKVTAVGPVVTLAAGRARAFAFSADGAWLGYVERGKGGGSTGNLIVGAVGGRGAVIAERVGQFWFAPDSKAVASLSNYDEKRNWGRLVYATLPEGKPIVLGARVSTTLWSEDNRFLAFNLNVFQPLPSVDLWLYARGKSEGNRIMTNVYGYDFAPGGTLLFRAECTRHSSNPPEARACNLETLDPTQPDAHPVPILEGIYGYHSSADGNRVLFTYARTDSETFDVGLYDLKTQVRKTIEERIVLPALFADPAGTRVVFLVSQGDRSGLYVYDQPR